MIDPKDAKEFYPTASPVWKRTLENTFGKELFSEKPQDRIKTVEDACEVLGINPESIYNQGDQPDEIAYKKLKIIVKALNFLANGNKEWVPDYDNSNQRKWYPWFYMDKPSGVRLFGCGYDSSATAVGARLVFLNEELARYAATQFLGLYSNYYGQ